MLRFGENQERWLHSKDFLSRGEIAEKDMLYLRPVTEQLAHIRVAKSPLVKNSISASAYSQMPGVSKKFLISLLNKHDNWHDKDRIRRSSDEQ